MLRLKANPIKGFTLLELLITLTILSLIVMVVFGAFRISIRAWEKGEQRIDSFQRYRIVLDLMRRQVMALQHKRFFVDPESVVKDEEKISPFKFFGDRENFSFFSRISLLPQNTGGQVFVSYRIVTDDDSQMKRLQIFEKSLLLLNKEAEVLELPGEAFVDLIPRAKDIYFEYLGDFETSEEEAATGTTTATTVTLNEKADDESASAEETWRESWDMELTENFPRAVRIVLQPENEDAPITVIVRVVADILTGGE